MLLKDFFYFLAGFLMNTQISLSYLIFVPLFGALSLPLLGKISAYLRNSLALVLTLVPLVISVLLWPHVSSGGVIISNITLPLGFNLNLQADALAVFMASVSSFISALIVVYSFSYISHYRNQNEYYFFVVLFVAAMAGLVYSANLIFLYIFWEITAIASWRLIGFFRNKEYVLKADKAFMITVFGALLMLLGFIMIYTQTGSFDIPAIKEAIKAKPLSGLVIVLILAGILSKSATLPFQTWLPDAGIAPSPVTALLHAAVLVKIGVYVFARLFVVNFPLIDSWSNVVLLIAAASTLISAGCAFIESDLKRIIAYSTISQIGFIFLGFASGTSIGIFGGLLYILIHGLGKAGLFLCAGVIEQNCGTKDINKLGGLAKTMPFTAAAFLICAFSIMGVPPTGGFFSKYMVLAGAFTGGHYLVAWVFLVCAVFTVLYLLRVFCAVFLGGLKINAGEGTRSMVSCIVILAVLSIAAGVFMGYLSVPLDDITKQMLALK